MTTLQCKPVPRISKPRYPSKRETQAIPALLQQNLPASWSLRPEIISAAALFLGIGINGCKEPESTNPEAGATEAIPETIVAPVFRHGAGEGPMRTYQFSITGGSGDGMITIYLKEEEARLVIQEELNKHGIHPVDQNIQLDNLEVPVYKRVSEREWTTDSWKSYEQEYQIPFQVDIVDLEKNIYIEFISCSDRYSFPKPNIPEEITFDVFFNSSGGFHYSRYPVIGEKICQLVKTDCSSDVYFGVVYDPGINWDMNEAFKNFQKKEEETWEENRDRRFNALLAAEQKAKEDKAYPLLRQQVQDLADWLKAQGAI